MAAMTYYVVLAFRRSEENGDIVAGDPNEARSGQDGRHISGGRRTLRRHSVSRTGDPALGDFEDVVILKMVGEVDIGLLST
jgi:hypothetical protein